MVEVLLDLVDSVAGLLAGAGWYSARLRAALRRLDQQHLQAERNIERMAPGLFELDAEVARAITTEVAVAFTEAAAAAAADRAAEG